jgi:putative transposase
MDLYHVLNRGVDKRTIFEDTQDHARFVHDMFEFNSTKKSKNLCRRVPMSDVGRHSLGREKLVDIHAWCLMKNHYHLLLSECVEGGISEFLKKLNGGYAKYFNEKNSRVGALFQGKTKKVIIDTDAHFLYILHYIHLNPLDFSKTNAYWRSGTIRNSLTALQYLEEYRWSSYLDYIGLKNFPSILTTDLYRSVFTDYRKTLQQYVRSLDISKVEEYTLE